MAEFQPRFPACNSAGALAWLRLKAACVERAPLGKRRSRDPKDDPSIACGLDARARFVVTRDEDLLVVGRGDVILSTHNGSIDPGRAMRRWAMEQHLLSIPRIAMLPDKMPGRRPEALAQTNPVRHVGFVRGPVQDGVATAMSTG